MKKPDSNSNSESVTLRDLYNMAEGNRDAVQQATKDLQFAIEQVQANFITKFEVQNDKMDHLIETTNHRLDNFENLVEARKLEFNQGLNKALSRSESSLKAVDLMPYIQLQILHSRLVWGITTLLVLAFGPLVVDNWQQIVQHLRVISGY